MIRTFKTLALTLSAVSVVAIAAPAMAQSGATLRPVAATAHTAPHVHDDNCRPCAQRRAQPRRVARPQPPRRVAPQPRVVQVRAEPPRVGAPEIQVVERIVERPAPQGQAFHAVSLNWGEEVNYGNAAISTGRVPDVNITSYTYLSQTNVDNRRGGPRPATPGGTFTGDANPGSAGGTGFNGDANGSGNNGGNGALPLPNGPGNNGGNGNGTLPYPNGYNNSGSNSNGNGYLPNPVGTGFNADAYNSGSNSYNNLNGTGNGNLPTFIDYGQQGGGSSTGGSYYTYNQSNTSTGNGNLPTFIDYGQQGGGSSTGNAGTPGGEGNP
jgi:hypothetical protein